MYIVLSTVVSNSKISRVFFCLVKIMCVALIKVLQLLCVGAKMVLFPKTVL